jgi:hypothetical protein
MLKTKLNKTHISSFFPSFFNFESLKHKKKIAKSFVSIFFKAHP